MGESSAMSQLRVAAPCSNTNRKRILIMAVTLYEAIASHDNHLASGDPQMLFIRFRLKPTHKGNPQKRTRYPATASKVLELGYTQQPQQPQQAQGPQETGGLEDGHVSHAKPLANSCAMSPGCCFLWAVKRINCSSPSLRIPSRRIRKPTTRQAKCGRQLYMIPCLK